MEIGFQNKSLFRFLQRKRISSFAFLFCIFCLLNYKAVFSSFTILLRYLKKKKATFVIIEVSLPFNLSTLLHNLFYISKTQSLKCFFHAKKRLLIKLFANAAYHFMVLIRFSPCFCGFLKNDALYSHLAVQIP